MEVIIKDKKFIFKDEITGREEHASGIMRYLQRLTESSAEKLNELMFDDSFNECALRLVAFMSLEPKMTKEQVLDLPNAIVLQLKLKCLYQYAKSLESLNDLFAGDEKKKLMTPSDISTDSFTFSEMRPIDQQLRLNLQKK